MIFNSTNAGGISYNHIYVKNGTSYTVSFRYYSIETHAHKTIDLLKSESRAIDDADISHEISTPSNGVKFRVQAMDGILNFIFHT